jgi:hypothetical protein
MGLFHQSFTIYTPIVLFVCIMLLLFYIKPRSIFQPNGAMRPLGISRPHSTLCPFWIISIGSAILIFLYMHPSYQDITDAD